MKIVCLGDSITGQADLRSYLKWSSILECILDSLNGDGTVQVLNRGIAGDTSADARKRLQGDVLDVQPDIVVMLLGGNDAGSGRSRSAVQADLEYIVQQSKNIGARVLMLQYALIPNPENAEGTWSHLNTNNALIAEIAAAEKVALLDMDEPMQAAFKNQSLNEFVGRENGIAHWAEKPLLQAHLMNPVDGVHLSPVGELVFARSIYRKLSGLGWL